MVASTARYGTGLVVLLVVLRLGIGWHFFKEGAKKLNDRESFTARHFLEQAKGPLAGFFQASIPDRWATARLDSDQTKARLRAYKDQVVDDLRFDASQRKQADQVLKTHLAYADRFFDEREEEIATYFREVDRLLEAQSVAARENMPYALKRLTAKQAELVGMAAPWLSDLDRFQASFARNLQEVAQQGGAAIAMPQFPDVSRSWIDSAVAYVVFGVGVLLVLGLFTRFAAVAGAAFLGAVIATQPPWVAGSEPTYYQFVELTGLLLLGVTAAGRFAGLDFFVNALRGRCCSSTARQATANHATAKNAATNKTPANPSTPSTAS